VLGHGASIFCILLTPDRAQSNRGMKRTRRPACKDSRPIPGAGAQTTNGWKQLFCPEVRLQPLVAMLQRLDRVEHTVALGNRRETPGSGGHVESRWWPPKRERVQPAGKQAPGQKRGRQQPVLSIWLG